MKLKGTPQRHIKCYNYVGLYLGNYYLLFNIYYRATSRRKGKFVDDNTKRETKRKRYIVYPSSTGCNCDSIISSNIHCTNRKLIIFCTFCIFKTTAKLAVPCCVRQHSPVSSRGESRT